MSSFNIVLYEPEMPANTGNIGRTCLATGTPLHLIGPLGFQLNDKALKRAGLDYWHELDVPKYDDYDDFVSKHPNVTVWKATTKAKRAYTDVRYSPGDYIMFGRESSGIPEEILVADEPHCIRIPMASDIRSLNLSNAAAVVLYEALRQQGFAGLETSGSLHRLSWGDNSI